MLCLEGQSWVVLESVVSRVVEEFVVEVLEEPFLQNVPPVVRQWDLGPADDHFHLVQEAREGEFMRYVDEFGPATCAF